MKFTLAHLVRKAAAAAFPSLGVAHGAANASSQARSVTNPSGESVALPDINDPVLPAAKEAILLDAIKTAFAHGRLGCDDWRPIVDAELRKRLYWFKYRYTPWLNSVMPLKGINVLEIGAGTGCSTIPLVEAGARVTSIDISEVDLKIAELRAQLHDVSEHVSFSRVDAAEIGSAFHGCSFDLIVYFASLEHMTYRERLRSLRAAWSLLPAGKFLAVCDTPNRLWYYDDHTSLQNFFHWIPDEIAVDYAARTARQKFNVDFLTNQDDSVVRLQRWGRCVSYHEFEIAFEVDISSLDVCGEWQYRREHGDSQWWAETWMNSDDGQFHRFLHRVEPRLPLAFIEPELAFTIRKP